MAAFDSESYHKSDIFSLRNPNGSPFGIPSCFIGFNPKVSSDNDSARSPTSPLDIVFSSLKNPFGFRFQKSSSHAVSEKISDCTKVGLGIINSLAEETEAIGEANAGAPGRKSIIFRPQVKKTDILDYTNYESLETVQESNFLPGNYLTSNIAVGNEGLLVTPEPLKDILASWSDSRPTTFSQNPNLGLKNFSSKNKSAIVKLIGRDSHVQNSLDSKPSSLPISIGSGHGHSLANTLLATDISLSEDYTCVVCHGPNPKTTHIFGDCILECHANELSNFARKEGQRIVVSSPQVAMSPEEPTPFPSDELLSFCHSCKNELKEGEDIYMYRGEKAFCSLECRSEVIIAEEETERSFNNSSRGSLESTSHEDLFVMGSNLLP